ncbi:MAG: hypothetical protein L3K17_06305 [Thermoplasmata archaeon]|nr:hypothetical protein [Thermoplasmata archaeon]
MFSLRTNSRRLVTVFALGIAVLIALPLPATGGHVGTAGGTSLIPPAGGLGATVTWDGTNINSGATSSSALTTSFSTPIDVHYVWANAGGTPSALAPSYTINDARLQFFYFGVALDTRDIVQSNAVPATNGTFDMLWDPGVFRYLFEGTFGLTASLLAPNGTAMWSQSFFIHAAAPFSLLAVLPIVLLLIVLYEGYGLARSGRQAGIVATKKGSPTPSPSSAKKAGETPAEPESDAPPSGGSP